MYIVKKNVDETQSNSSQYFQLKNCFLLHYFYLIKYFFKLDLFEKSNLDLFTILKNNLIKILLFICIKGPSDITLF